MFDEFNTRDKETRWDIIDSVIRLKTDIQIKDYVANTQEEMQIVQKLLDGFDKSDKETRWDIIESIIKLRPDIEIRDYVATKLLKNFLKEGKEAKWIIAESIIKFEVQIETIIDDLKSIYIESDGKNIVQIEKIIKSIDRNENYVEDFFIEMASQLPNNSEEKKHCLFELIQLEKNSDKTVDFLYKELKEKEMLIKDDDIENFHYYYLKKAQKNSMFLYLLEGFDKNYLSMLHLHHLKKSDKSEFLQLLFDIDEMYNTTFLSQLLRRVIESDENELMESVFQLLDKSSLATTKMIPELKLIFLTTKNSALRSVTKNIIKKLTS